MQELKKLPIPKKVTAMLQMNIGDELGWVEKRKKEITPCGRVTERTGAYIVVQLPDGNYSTYSRKEITGKVTITKYGCPNKQPLDFATACAELGIQPPPTDITPE